MRCMEKMTSSSLDAAMCRKVRSERQASLRTAVTATPSPTTRWSALPEKSGPVTGVASGTKLRLRMSSHSPHDHARMSTTPQATHRPKRVSSDPVGARSDQEVVVQRPEGPASRRLLADRRSCCAHAPPVGAIKQAWKDYQREPRSGHRPRPAEDCRTESLTEARSLKLRTTGFAEADQPLSRRNQNWLICARRDADPGSHTAANNRSVAGTSLQAAWAGLTLRSRQPQAADDRRPCRAFGRDGLAADDW